MLHGQRNNAGTDPDVIPFGRGGKSAPAGNNDQLDKAGQTFLQLLNKAADVAEGNSRHAIDMAQKLSHQLVVGPHWNLQKAKARRSRAGYLLSPTSGQRETKKRWPRVPLHNSLFVHLRRWRRLGEHMWSNETAKDVDRAFRAVARSAGLPWATPHVIRPIA